MAYINKYSPRAGTKAEQLEDSVSQKEKKERELILNNVLKETALKNNQKYIGKTMEVLIEESKKDMFYGHTKNYKKVGISAEVRPLQIGEFVKVKIIEATSWGLRGEYVK